METKKTKLLILDDERDFTHLLKANLEDTGEYDVRVVNRAADAVSATRQFRPDFILLDVLMPDGHGGDVAAELKKLPDTRDIPVTFLTAAVRRAELGAPDGVVGGRNFIAKPVTLEDLTAHIKRRLASTSAQKN